MFRDFLGHETGRGAPFLSLTQERKNFYVTFTNSPRQACLAAGWRAGFAINKPSVSLNMPCDIFNVRLFVALRIYEERSDERK